MKFAAPDDSVDGAPGTKVAEEFRALRSEAARKQEGVKKLREEVEEATATRDREVTKLAQARREHAKHEQHIEEQKVELKHLEDRYKQLSDQASANRDRAVIIEYLDKLARSPEEALAFLTRWANLSADPTPTLTEIARLRDHHRGCIDKRQ